MHKENKTLWITVIGTGLVMIMIIVGVVVYASKGQQPSDNALTRESASTSEQSTGQGTPTYSSQDCEPQTGCTAPQNQSQGQGVAPTEGTITAVSDSSISIRPSDGSAVKTFRVTNGAQVMKSTASSSYNAGDLKIGQAVTVVPMLNDSTTVEYIALDNTGRLNNVNE